MKCEVPDGISKSRQQCQCAIGEFGSFCLSRRTKVMLVCVFDAAHASCGLFSSGPRAVLITLLLIASDVCFVLPGRVVAATVSVLRQLIGLSGAGDWLRKVLSSMHQSTLPVIPGKPIRRLLFRHSQPGGPGFQGRRNPSSIRCLEPLE